jgi:hypothetical protein
VKQIISSPRLAGLRMLGGELYTDEDGQPVISQWERIIEPAEWEAVAARYRPRTRIVNGSAKPAAENRTRKYLLSGLLRCGNVVGCIS